MVRCKHMTKILIFGGGGFIAGHLQATYPDAVMPKTDIADAAAVAAVLDAEKPDVVINAAGKTGRPNVDWCESHKEETIRSNIAGPLVLLEECGKRGIYWVHIGSGCIYDGDNGGRGFTEEDPPNFTGSFYSRSKLWSDQILAEFPVLQLRLRMPFDGSTHPRNLITKLSKYSKILDVPNSITYIPDFLKALKALVEKRATGVYNAVNPGAASPYEIMSRYREIVDPSKVVEPLTLQDLSSVVTTGRSNCILSPKKMIAEGIELMPVDKALEIALKQVKAGRA